jgi:hypothetical protein
MEKNNLVVEYFVIEIRKDLTCTINYMYKQGSPTKKVFSCNEEAEAWIEDNYPDNWIDHKINGDIGSLMLFEFWVKCVDGGGFTDDDGYGDILDEKYNIIKRRYYPSNYEGEKPKNAKYILWYNR